MEFAVKRLDNPNIEKYKEDELSLAYEFSKKVFEEFGSFLKAVVLFGSTARRAAGTQEPAAQNGEAAQAEAGESRSDIDMLVVVDDTTIVFTQEIAETYRIILEKIIAQTSPRLHVTSLKLSSFWEYVRSGDPVAVNLLRDGIALLDTGFFDPLQALLYRGRIRPSPEAIWTYFARAPRTLNNARWHMLQAAIDMYWAVVDAAHAALMKLGETPPSPDHVAGMIEEKLVRPKLVDQKYAKIMRDFYNLQKMIVYRDLKQISGHDFERYYKDAADFVNKMQEVINKMKTV